MDQMTPFERQMSGELGALAGPGRRIDPHAMTRAVATQPQERGIGRLLSAIALGTAGLFVVAFGAMLASGMLGTAGPSEPVPGAADPTTPAVATADATSEPTTTEPEIPADLPEGVQAGSIATPAGPIRWVHHRTDIGTVGPERTLPLSKPTLVPWVDGMAVLSGGNGLWSTGFFVSADGIGWTELDLPTDSVSAVMTAVGDGYVLSDGGTRMWLSDDGLEWRELDTSAIDEAIPSGWAHAGTTLATPPFLDDGRAVFSVDVDYRLPFERLGIEIGTIRGLRPAKADVGKARWNVRYRLCNIDCNSSRWVVRFKETETGLRVIDHKTGESLGVLKGADASQIYRNSRVGRDRVPFEIVGDRVEPIADLPSVPEEAPPSGNPAGTDVVRAGSSWLAFDERGPGPHGRAAPEAGPPWVHVGGTWVSLADVFGESREYGQTRLTGHGDMVASVWSQGPDFGFWIVTLPS